MPPLPLPHTGKGRGPRFPLTRRTGWAEAPNYATQSTAWRNTPAGMAGNSITEEKEVPPPGERTESGGGGGASKRGQSAGQFPPRLRAPLADSEGGRPAPCAAGFQGALLHQERQGSSGPRYADTHHGRASERGPTVCGLSTGVLCAGSSCQTRPSGRRGTRPPFGTPVTRPSVGPAPAAQKAHASAPHASDLHVPGTSPMR